MISRMDSGVYRQRASELLLGIEKILEELTQTDLPEERRDYLEGAIARRASVAQVHATLALVATIAEKTPN